MPFIVVFNMVIAILLCVDFFVVLATSFMLRTKEKSDNIKLQKVRAGCYIVFFAIIVLMMLVNLIV